MGLNQIAYGQLMRTLPKKWMSHYLGALSQLKLPAAVNQRLIQLFVDQYRIDAAEAEKPLADYPSLSEFFSRKLKEGARPLGGELVHPCDGVLIESGRLQEGKMIQAKGKTFSLAEFVPDNPWRADFVHGSFFTYYLAPHNYHRIHSPVTGEVCWSNLIPGELWPVNSWSVKNVEELYAQNERVATGIQTPHGKVILTMVGATNVGSMSFTYDPNIRTNLLGKKEVVFRDYPEARKLNVGDELGTFHLGSTVVLMFEQSWDLHHQPRHEVKMGEKFNK